jgi:hypothetical protein
VVLISDGAGGGEEPLFFGSLDDAGLLPPPFLLLVLFVAMVDTKDSFWKQVTAITAPLAGGERNAIITRLDYHPRTPATHNDHNATPLQ